MNDFKAENMVVARNSASKVCLTNVIIKSFDQSIQREIVYFIYGKNLRGGAVVNYLYNRY